MTEDGNQQPAQNQQAPANHSLSSVICPLTSGKPLAIHAMGVGGMGLGPLAIYLQNLGHHVSGSDDHLTDVMRVHLERAGVTLAPSRPGSNAIPPATQLLVISSAVPSGHSAVIEARARGIPMLRRGELLAHLAASRRLVAICGSHGKTTTTALLITALRAANLPADYILGGLFADDSIPPAAAIPQSGRGEPSWLVAEIDESDGTIEKFSPEITLVTNVDWDHPDHYHTRADLDAAFDRLFARTRRHVIRDTPLLPDPFPPAIRGAFNRQNASAALAAASHMGVPASLVTPALLASFPGVRRRQTILHSEDNLTIIEDYAHHPAEISALLASLREPDHRLIVVFQPHRYSRTRQFLHEFAKALSLADEVHLLDVYPAGEAVPATPGATTADLARLLPEATHHAGANPRLQSLSPDRHRTPVILAFVGAGNIDATARHWLASRARWDAACKTLRSALPPGSHTKLHREEPLAPKTTMGVGGSARIYTEPASIADLTALVRAASAASIPIFMLGRGSNLIVPDEGVDALVLSLRHPSWSNFTLQPNGTLRVGAGLRLKELCGKAMLAGLRGFEFLEGIPGNVGGALHMNAGAMGGWIFDRVESIDLLTYSGEQRTLRRHELHTGYRHCAELENAIALVAILRPDSMLEDAARQGHADIARQVDAYRDKRKKSQPREPSAGCIFKNPEGDAAGRLIDAAGLKGLRIGDAEVSTIHANFIVNHGHATAADIIALVREIRTRVHAASGITLQPEAILYGSSWDNVLKDGDSPSPTAKPTA